MTPVAAAGAAIMGGFVRDPDHWLKKYSPKEWIRAALKEMRAAEESFKQRNVRAGVAGCRRAAGMALNAALVVEPNEAWKRTYVEHVQALAKDAAVPAAVRASAERLLEAPGAGGELIILRRASHDEVILEAARDVMAHAYAVVVRHEQKTSS
jgi:HEPN domain-containing protein